ncbi:MAG: ABC transporter permease [Blastocatellales bacterium]
MQTVIQDLRYGFRLLLKQPVFTLIAIVTLALGIGANTAIFSVVNAALLSPLPYPNPDQIVRVYTNNPSRGWNQSMVSLHDFRDWEVQNQAFSQLAAFNQRSANVTGSDQPERIDYSLVTANLFSVLGTEALLGRTFTAEEDQPGHGNVVVLSYRFWQRSFGGDKSVIGKSLQLNGENCVIVGVMPARVRFPSPDVELWKPIAMTPESTGERSGRWLEAIARLKPGVSQEQAQAEMQTIAARLAQTYPESNQGWGVEMMKLHQQQVSDFRPALLLMWGAVGLVLLIACANVANLLLARAAFREKEIAIRSALGAGRGRIVRQLLTESLILALLGGLAGWLLAIWGTELLPDLSAGGFLSDVKIDRHVLFYSLAIAFFTGILFGMIPALKAAKTNLNETLKDGGRNSYGSSNHRARNLLVIGEIALTLLLLIGAGLLLRSFVRLLNVDPGFDPRNLLTFKVAPPQTQPLPGESESDFFERFSNERQQMAGFYRNLIGHIEALPGVETVGATNVLPLSGNRWTVGFDIEGLASRTRADQPTAYARVVSPNFLRAMKTRLIEGREFNEFDIRQSEPVAVISQTMAKRHWLNDTAIGKRIRFGENPEIFKWVKIVGVVSDVRLNDMETEPDAVIYIPFPQAIFGHFGDWGMTLAVRTKSNPAALIGAIRQQVSALDRTLPVYQVRTMEQVISESVAQRRSSMTLLMIFALLALVLAVIGIYGVISYSVNQRTHELGIRAALGAGNRDILKLIIGQGLMLTLIGIGIGLIASFALTQILSGMLFGVGATDPVTFIGIPLLLVLIATLACYLPARKATKVDPMTVLRCE